MAAIDPAKAKAAVTFNHSSTFFSLAHDPASNRLYAGSDDYGIYVFDPAGQVRLFVRHDQPAADLVHDIRLLLAG